MSSPRWIAALLTLLILIFAVRCYLTYGVFSETADEAVHIAAGLEVWQQGRYTLEPQHPPLGRAAIALLPFLAGVRVPIPPTPERPLRVSGWFAGEPGGYWRTLRLARLGNLIFLPFLMIYVYLWGRRLHGPVAGVAASALVSFSPNLLAHGSLATLDFGAATTIFIASYHFWRWSLESSRRNALAAGLALGLAAATKFSALFLAPPMAIAFFLLARRRPSPTHAAWFAAVAVMVVCAAYRFEVGRLPATRFPAPPSPTLQLQQAVSSTAGSARVPLPAFFAGLLDVLGHNAQGHHCYLLGRLAHSGWWYYFPVVLALKTTIPLLMLVAIGLAHPARAPLVAAAVVLAACMSSNLNMGVRHILVIYPFLALSTGWLFAAPRRWAVAAFALVAWHAVESLAASPDYLAYFNQSVRGREEQYLVDSNLDWGQDLERLRLFLQEKKPPLVYLSYFGRADPAEFGIARIRPLPPELRPHGWVAVSKAHIAGLALDGYDLGWLRQYPPAARIGKSMLVYYFP